MEKITLDLSKLLGFKIVSREDTRVTLESPKIGTKGCSVFDDAAAARTSPLVPKIGSKLP